MGVEAIRFLIWVRVFRARKINQFFKQMEKDIRINYLFTRIVKLVMVELYCTHTGACKVPLFQGCSDEFLNQIVMRLNEEFFLPGDVVIEQGSPADQVYIILLGYLVSAELLMM
ncbi:hypothetical protein BHE74_00014719 [Ensete ventricosum]|nr:hypothetical protein BHE74_00014719 [Ensete ventricosum]